MEIIITFIYGIIAGALIVMLAKVMVDIDK